MINISGYNISEKIYESSSSLVYRGSRNKDNKPLIIKILNKEYPTNQEIARFKNEFHIIKEITSEGIIEAYNIENYKNTVLLFLEDFGGKAFSEIITNNKIDLVNFLNISLKITEILGIIHKKKYIHNDINPSNILFNKDTGEIKIIDYGISVHYSQVHLLNDNKTILEGTLAYISPEQTKRVNRLIDYRSDFYSLGITFYEMLLGFLPFKTKDTSELIHSHIAKIPKSPYQENHNIPKVVSDIIMKLLSKNPDDRYQSIEGILNDLKKSLDRIVTSGVVNDFKIGEKDFSDKFQISNKLYGRTKEIEKLYTAFERVLYGSYEIAFVGGISGIGKTALINHFNSTIKNECSCNFISGKFESSKQDIPYFSLIQAFQKLIRQILTENEETIKYWREKLVDTLRNNTQVIIEVIPELELIIGKQQKILEVTPAEAQNRFKIAFSNFIQAFASSDSPLLIFLDDLQWADSASINLIDYLSTLDNMKYIFIIGTYRNEDNKNIDQLYELMHKSKIANNNLENIVLGSLHLESINEFISNTFNTSLEKVSDLSELCLKKTYGNPFFLSQFLISLYNKKYIYFDIINHSWCWDILNIEKAGVTDNVIELLLDKIKSLSEDTQKILKLASCIGQEFDLNTLSILNNKTKIETIISLLEAVKEGIILSNDENCSIFNYYNNNLITFSDNTNLNEMVEIEFCTVKFFHDRIYQAVYSLLDDDERKKIHLAVGQYWLKDTAEIDYPKKVFVIVNQLNIARELINNEIERNELLKLNFIAGIQAKSTIAYQTAFNYFQIAISLLKDDPWENNYDQTLSLYIELAESSYLNGDFDSLEEASEMIINKAKNLIDKLRIYEIKMLAYIQKMRAPEAINIGIEILKLLKINIPKKPNKLYIAYELIKTRLALLGKSIEKLYNLPEMTDEYKKIIIRILTTMSSAAYFCNPDILPVLVFRMVRLSAKYGNSSLSILPYNSYASICCGVTKEIEKGFNFGQLALKLQNKLNAKDVTPKNIMIYNTFIVQWKKHLEESLEPLLEGYKISLENGDIEYAGYNIMVYIENLYLAGKNLLLVEQEANKYIKMIDPFKQESTLNNIKQYYQSTLNLLESKNNAHKLLGNVYNEEKMLPIHLATNDYITIWDMYFNKFILCYIFNEYEEAQECITQAKKYNYSIATVGLAILNFYDSLVQIANYFKANSSQKKVILKKVHKNQKMLQKWAKHSPYNFLHKYYLVEAELNRILKDELNATKLYDTAIELAKKNKYLQEEAIAYELASKFYMENGREASAKLYINEAYYAYERWGANAKLKQLKDKYPSLIHIFHKDLKPRKHISAIKTDSTTENFSSDVIDFISIIKSSNAIFNEIILENLLRKMIKIVIENAGAQKGFLVLNNHHTNKLTIEAEGYIDKKEVIVLQSIPIESSLSLAVRLVKYVANTKETIILDDASTDEKFANDMYIKTNSPKSILCIPVLYKQELNSIIYLENDLITGAFTEKHLNTLSILSSQIAISIENARLYAKLEEKIKELNKEINERKIIENELLKHREHLEELVEDRTKELNEKNKELQKLSKLKDDFVTIVSHDLRSPFNSILGISQMILFEDKKNPLIPRHKNYIELIQSSAQGLLTMVEELLNLAALETGKITLSQKDNSLKKIIDDSYNRLVILFENKEIDFINDIIEDYRVFVDYKWLIEVITNFFSNAIKYTYRQGKITISANIHTVGNDNNYILVCIEDNGTGIPEILIPHLFEKHKKTSTKGTEGEIGTGFGLPLCKQIIDLHKGKVWIESKENIGTKVFFTLPKSIIQ